jgi:tetratricopeptide (TPR) repeat protein
LQLTERRKGNTAYRAGDYSTALEHYERAKSIVELVRGLSRADQNEVDLNKITVLCNLAAVYLATKEFGAAVEICSKALELDPGCVKALTRRCKAYIGRHEYDAAQADIKELKQMARGNTQQAAAAAAAELAMAVQHAQIVDKKNDTKTFGNMFDRRTKVWTNTIEL